MQSLPIIDISPLLDPYGDWRAVADNIYKACTGYGFFYIKGHGVSQKLQDQLEEFSKRFFALDHESKMQIHMSKAGKAWRGYFPVGEELTSGKPDIKEGLYFGEELAQDHKKVSNHTYLHGANLFPQRLLELKEIVLQYMEAMTDLGHALMRGLSLSLDFEANYFNKYYTADPFILFRIFHYPAESSFKSKEDLWGVGEHTDYGVLTILKQDNNGGLQVKSKGQWIEAPPIPNTFVCNIGDMLERMTKGLYLSTPHRVLNTSGRDRLSFPLFFDPNFDAEVRPLPVEEHRNDLTENLRWDNSNVHEFKGTFGDYILQKVSKVFPDL